MSKRTCLSLLVLLNAFLLAAIVLSSAWLPRAWAQGTGLAGNYLSVAGEIQDEYDALYVLDLKSRTLHSFVFDKGGRKLQHRDVRDLERDFRNNRD